ncbi:hypothetical protein [Terriglobus sp. ADX1]|uniref:hypothetical protein n=1 Tax=Terriglobus sp. ADX1 TaxID=2794063 RepID=UPI002FE5C06A
MKVTTISASAGRKFSHPTEPFGNMLVSATFTAELEGWENTAEAANDLQRMADNHVDAEKQRLLAACSQQPQWANNKAQRATENKADSLLMKHSGGK